MHFLILKIPVSFWNVLKNAISRSYYWRYPAARQTNIAFKPYLAAFVSILALNADEFWIDPF